MAIHFHRDFGEHHGTRNFGDDINPFLLGKLFHPSIIASKSLCLIGVGTIIDNDNAAMVSDFARKIVFSSGAGYGSLDFTFDDSWDFVCVRGPKTAAALELPPEKAICDGAILLADIYPPKSTAERDGIVFIPHINTDWSSGRGLRSICKKLGLIYLSPDAPFETFIDTIRSASLVITEAMHGAILSDAMRTPWIPVRFHNHNRFKWEDWFASINLPYASHSIAPHFWDAEKPTFKEALRTPLRAIKHALAARSLRTLMSGASALLSDDAVMEARKQSLREQVESINDRYAS